MTELDKTKSALQVVSTKMRGSMIASSVMNVQPRSTRCKIVTSTRLAKEGFAYSQMSLVCWSLFRAKAKGKRWLIFSAARRWMFGCSLLD